MDKKRLLVMSILLLCTLGLSACLSYLPKAGTPESPFTVLGELSGQSVEEIVEAEIVISRGKHRYQKIVPVSNNEFEAALQIPVGEWDLSVFLIDAHGKIQYQSEKKTLHTQSGKQKILEIVLRPAASIVHVAIDLENYLFREQALRARIHFNDDIHELIREYSEDPFATEIEVVPGSYEFKIELYTESFRIGDRLGPDSWQVIQVLPKEELNIVWKPAKEQLMVSGRVELLLPGPVNLNARSVEQGVHLTWDPLPEPNVKGYLVFAQTDPFDRFHILNSTPVQDSSFLYTWDEEENPPNALYTVAAVSAKGLVGYYAQPLDFSH